MTTVKKEKLSELVAAGVKGLIVDGGLKPGDRLPTENELAQRFGVSRVSVREATQALAFLGIIQSAPRRGLSVGEVDWDRASQYLGFHFAISKYPPETLVKARVVIETGALPYTMEAFDHDPTLFGELMARVDRMARACGDLDRFIEEDIAFHRALVESSGIEPLVAFTDLLHSFFTGFREEVRAADRRSGNQEHRRLLLTIREGNLAESQELVRRHIEDYTLPSRRSAHGTRAGDRSADRAAD